MLRSPLSWKASSPEEPSEHPALQTTPSVDVIPGLDGPHSVLLRELSSKATWDRSGLEASAARLSLLTDGAIEVINERALDVTGEPVLEGDDPVSVNFAVLKELMP